MSESLKECEVEGFEPNGDHVARGKWQCGSCAPPKGELVWESRVEKKIIEQVGKPENVAKYIEFEHRAFRDAVGREVEKHLKEH